MADYDTRHGERARDWYEDRDRWNRDQAGSRQWRRDAGDRWMQDRSDDERGDRDRMDRNRWQGGARPYATSHDEHSRYYGGTYRAGQHWPADGRRPSAQQPDYAHGMHDDMQRYAGRERDEGDGPDYGPYGSLYGRRDDRDRAFEYGPYSRGSGFGGGYYGTGGGYFGTTGGGGFGGRDADFGSREYGGVREFRDRNPFAGRAGNDWNRGATGYVGGYRGEDYRYAGSRSGSRGGGDRGWWDRTADEVRSWFGDDEAERRRRMDDQSSHRGRGPKGYARSDDRIREDVSDRLTEDPHLDASEIDVTVASAEVTLNGSVEHRWAKRHAEDIAEGVSGVKHVQNNLRLREAAANSAGGTAGAGFTVQPGQTAGARGSSMTGAAAGSSGSVGGQSANTTTTAGGASTTGRSGT